MGSLSVEALASASLDRAWREALKAANAFDELQAKAPKGHVTVHFDEDDGAFTLVRVSGFGTQREIVRIAEYVDEADAVLIAAWLNNGPGLVKLLRNFAAVHVMASAASTREK